MTLNCSGRGSFLFFFFKCPCVEHKFKLYPRFLWRRGDFSLASSSLKRIFFLFRHSSVFDSNLPDITATLARTLPWFMLWSWNVKWSWALQHDLFTWLHVCLQPCGAPDSSALQLLYRSNLLLPLARDMISSLSSPDRDAIWQILVISPQTSRHSFN